MKSCMSLLTVVLIAGFAGTAAQAACGGGGYKPAPVVRNDTYSGASSSAVPTEYRSNSQAQNYHADVSGFDSQRFNRISGRLGMSQQQATDVIKAMVDVRSTDGKSKDYNAQKEFDKRLSTILTEQQFKTYQSLI